MFNRFAAHSALSTGSIQQFSAYNSLKINQATSTLGVCFSTNNYLNYSLEATFWDM